MSTNANQPNLLGAQAGNGPIFKLNATAKLLFFILVSIACMMTYDTRFLAAVGVLALVCLLLSGVRFETIKTPLKVITVFAILNLLFVFLFDRTYGDRLYGTSSPLLPFLSKEEGFYLLNVGLKYFCTVPLALLFLLTTNPSQFASSLNRIGVNYKVAYSVSLALRYIPDVQEAFYTIKDAQQARGLELTHTHNLLKKIKANVVLLTPLIFSSLDKIDTISTAMELRRFGSQKTRTWYRQQAFTTRDWLIVGLALLILIIAIALWFVNNGRFYNPFS
jgi:energy-coupling factor transport system permease protein